MKSLSWQTHEYVHREKTQDWFWVLGIVAGAVAITSLIFGNVLFAIVVIVGAFVLALFAARPPQVVQVEVNEKGVTVDKNSYPLRTLKSFWIDDTHADGPRLILRSSRAIMPYVIVPIATDDMDSIKALLGEKLPSEPFEESQLQLFLERIGF